MTLLLPVANSWKRSSWLLGRLAGDTERRGSASRPQPPGRSASRDGATTGKVIALLDRDGERYVVFDRGNPLVTRRRIAIPWRDVESVDHDTLTVRLALAEGDLAATVELDPANEIEDGDAEAVRVTELPRELTPSSGLDQGAWPN